MGDCRNWDDDNKRCEALHTNCNATYGDCGGDPTDSCEVGDSNNDILTYPNIA